MAVHTYVINPLSVASQTSTDVLWNCTGTADGIAFAVSFWQTAVAGMTAAQLKTFVKTLVDAQVFPVIATPSGNLAAFQGGSFTQ